MNDKTRRLVVGASRVIKMPRGTLTMASNLETDERRQERLRKRRERDRLRRERETDEECQARLVNAKLSLHKANDFCPLHDID